MCRSRTPGTGVMAVRKKGAKKRQLSVSQQLVLTKVKRAFDDVVPTCSKNFWLEEDDNNVDYALQLWDCFAEVYPKIQSLHPGKLTMEERRQIIADLMVWSGMDAHDEITQQFVLAPHLQDTTFISTGRLLREAMAERGMLAANDTQIIVSDRSDSESQGSNLGE